MLTLSRCLYVFRPSIGLVNPNCVGLVGNGVVVHLPSFFKELDELQSQGLDCANRLFISDRAQLVFDFHQIVDGLKEVELGRSRYGSISTPPFFYFPVVGSSFGLFCEQYWNYEEGYRSCILWKGLQVWASGSPPF